MKIVNNNILGLAGEVFAKSYCKENNIKFKKSTKDEDMIYGIDAYIGEEKTPIDIKNTADVFICQILEDGTVNTRHPFKPGTKATHYFVVEVDGMGNGKYIETVSIKERLLRDFIKSEKDYDKFKEYLLKIDRRSYHKLGINLSQACYKIKQEILQYCKENINLHYEEPVGGNQEISFKLIKGSKKRTVKPANSDSIKLIRNSIKAKMISNDIVDDTPQKDNVIVIKI